MCTALPTKPKRSSTCWQLATSLWLADAIRPFNAKRADVRKILTSAAENFEALVALWEGIHGKA